MAKTKVSLRRAYGKPWSEILKHDTIDKQFLLVLGRLLLKNVKREAKKDLAAQGNTRTPHGMPEGLPTDKKFFDSFGTRVTGASSVEIYSTWSGWERYVGPNWRYASRKVPLSEQLTEGRRAFKMKWLTRDKGVGIVPLNVDGKVLFRWAPKTEQDAWIHPGFERHNFIERAFKNTKRDMGPAVTQAFQRALKRHRRSTLG